MSCGKKKSHRYLNKPAAKTSKAYLTFCYPQVLKGYVHVVYFFSIDNVNQKSFLKTTFE